ncbi:mRNA-capping enzyme-like isoform X1 [Cimex lectularius]|uniref:mRNA-capping enzyme n=1 Tax=Cimex lectularius TaxID=79782 RepID=A0A8I6TFB7_CIMLE|nr:mRNA-capping enzyme-like isoform X1 [Cimex lectularius]XP_024083798.1 mRNA-capping enzyme-like isoform X1 [Cimex lectularius]
MSNPGLIPNRWLNCPRKASHIIGDYFFAFKTPLDSKYDGQVPESARFTPEMLIMSTSNWKKRIGLWIDLTNTSRYYDMNKVTNGYNDGKKIIYEKIECRGRDETPTPEQTNHFITICQRFIQQNPLDIIGIHCTHGFNRTGFLIASYLIAVNDWGPCAALQEFARARPPGIYKGDYIIELYSRYGSIDDAPNPPLKPSWCFESGNKESGNNGQSSSSRNDEEEDDDDDDDDDSDVEDKEERDNSNRRDEVNDNNDVPRKRFKSADNTPKDDKKSKFKKKKEIPTFMEGISGVEPVTKKYLVQKLRAICNKMAGWTKKSFPGCQPVSMTRPNIKYLMSHKYVVSWKADGTRYMMLIKGENEVYFLDRNNNFFKVSGLKFVSSDDLGTHLSDTLLDGEMVIDEYNGAKIPRYLVYDILYLNGEDVKQELFYPNRLYKIKTFIIKPRIKAICEGKLDKAAEPFSVRIKDFYPIEKTKSYFSEKFSKQLSHEPDGLIFQPAYDPYIPGAYEKVLKWKPPSMNSIDFLMKVETEKGQGIIPRRMCNLYVSQLIPYFGTMPYTKDMAQYDNKIIECSYQNGGWVFMRERKDKSFPNSLSTASAVLESIKNPITKECLLHFIDKIDRVSMPPPSSTK